MPGLELHEEGPGRTAWIAQRAGWAMMLLIVLSALSGVFGAGPLERAHARRDGLELSYPRFQRMTRTFPLEVTAPPSPDGRTRLWVDREYAARFEILGVAPEPESSASSRGKLLYTFRGLAGEPFAATFHLRASDGTFGRVRGSIGLENGARLDFSHFIWP